ncbi:rab3 interacting molecule [Anaeramoeba flamelloides]|uniref:Rab3 interacting molecule n=1 Tax=Anaeramoeba flamelloides TaxID=1746091 RepID=A0ABQ8YL24_9EUKA|nr:rab3 interacting molecule [Anaeramoeba flamelloides]
MLFPYYRKRVSRKPNQIKLKAVSLQVDNYFAQLRPIHFRVNKLNRWKQTQQRILRLNKWGILIIQPMQKNRSSVFSNYFDEQDSKLGQILYYFCYDNIQEIQIVNSQIFHLLYLNGEQHAYQHQFALLIAEEISSRCNVWDARYMSLVEFTKRPYLSLLFTKNEQIEEQEQQQEKGKKKEDEIEKEKQQQQNENEKEKEKIRRNRTLIAKQSFEAVFLRKNKRRGRRSQNSENRQSTPKKERSNQKSWRSPKKNRKNIKTKKQQQQQKQKEQRQIQQQKTEKEKEKEKEKEIEKEKQQQKKEKDEEMEKETEKDNNNQNDQKKENDQINTKNNQNNKKAQNQETETETEQEKELEKKKKKEDEKKKEILKLKEEKLRSKKQIRLLRYYKQNLKRLKFINCTYQISIEKSNIDSVILRLLVDEIIFKPEQDILEKVTYFTQNFQKITNNSELIYTNITKFIAGLQNKIIKGHIKELNFLPPKKYNKTRSNELIMKIIKKRTEQVLLIPVYDKIINLISKTTVKEQKKINKSLKKLRPTITQDLSFIPKKLQTSTNWKAAIRNLPKFIEERMPSKQLKIISETGDMITQTVKNGNLDEKLLNADNFIFIYFFILVKSNIPNLEAHLVYLENLAAEEQLNDKEGFFFTSIRAAVDLLKDFANKDPIIENKVLNYSSNSNSEPNSNSNSNSNTNSDSNSNTFSNKNKKYIN